MPATPIMIPALADDGTLYPVEKMDAHRRGVRHQAVSAFVLDGDRMLLQRRAAGKYHCGGLWANTCCTHPNWGESAADSAHRRVGEELGFDLPLTAHEIVEYEADVGSGLTEHERVHIFIGQAREADLAVRPNPAEVSETAWQGRLDIKARMMIRPDTFAPWFRIYMARWPHLIFRRA